jgi:hypothetical protein
MRPLPRPHQTVSPCAYRLALPVLYCVTFMVMCFLQPLQKAFLVLGTFTWGLGGEESGLMGCVRWVSSAWMGLGEGTAQTLDCCRYAAAVSCLGVDRLQLDQRAVSADREVQRLRARCARC